MWASSDQIGDRPRPLPKIPELKEGVDLTERKAQPAWDWKEEEGVWSWVNPPPASRKTEENGSGSRSGSRKSLTIGQRLLKEFGCGICKKVLKLPLSTPCGHNFCKLCLESAFSGQKDVRERVGVGGRSLRAQKVVKRCPTCQGDISELLQNPQVNRQMEDVIQSLKRSSQDDSDEESAEGGDEKYEKRGGQADAAEKEMPNHTEDNNGPSKLPQGAHSVLAQSSNGVPKLKLDPLKEEQFMKICERFPEYSEDLLRSMLADQDGDLDELEGMLRTLQKEERKRTRKELQDAKKRGNKNGGVRGEEEEEENDGEKGRPRKKRKKEKEEEEEGA